MTARLTGMSSRWLSSLRRYVRRTFRKKACAAHSVVTRPVPRRHDGALENAQAVRKREEEKRLDQALRETFPASDPISPYIPARNRKSNRSG